MPSKKYLILRSPRSGRLEGRDARLATDIFDTFTRSQPSKLTLPLRIA